MTKLAFIPSQLRSWSTVRDGLRSVHVTGWAAYGDGVLSDESLGRHINDGLNAALPFSDIVNGMNGNFAVAVDSPEAIHLGVDAVRSIPLFYRVGEDMQAVSDDIRSLYQDRHSFDEHSAIEFATAGYVTGPHTLFREISGLQSGECLSWMPGDTAPTARRYCRYLCSYDADSPVEELCETFDHDLRGAFSRIIESLKGRQVVVPLSGGLDSRLVASMFRRCGYDDVICVTYGVPGNRESERSKKVAEALGDRWLQVPYSRKLWREALDSDQMRDYWGSAANGVSVPHCDDWPAVRILRDHRDISADAVFVPGHTGDFICGSHLKYLFDPIWHIGPHDFEEAIVRKHYSLWEDLIARDGIRTVVGGRINETLKGLARETDEDLARMYEYWEWQERQAKLIINSVRSYEFSGFAWRIPLWDRAILEFWQRVPIALKMDKYLYRRYLAAYDPTGVFQSEIGANRWERGRVMERRKPTVRMRAKANLHRIAPLATLLNRREKYQRFRRDYDRHPLGLAQAYGRFRYLFREPSKRHTLSLLLKDFLRYEYGLDISALPYRHQNGTVPSVQPRANPAGGSSEVL